MFHTTERGKKRGEITLFLQLNMQNRLSIKIIHCAFLSTSQDKSLAPWYNMCTYIPFQESSQCGPISSTDRGGVFLYKYSETGAQAEYPGRQGSRKRKGCDRPPAPAPLQCDRPLGGFGRGPSVIFIVTFM